MANKSNLSTILGVAGATVLAAGGSAFVTDTGLNMVEKRTANVQESEVVVSEKETETPITVETFTVSKDSFTVKPVSDSENKKKNSDKSATDKKDQTSAEGSTSGSAEGGSSEVTSGNSYYDEDGNYYEGSSNSGNNGGGSGSGTVSAGNVDVAYYDEWGGWMATNGDYYDGMGGYYDGDGYHYVGDSIKNPSSSGSSSSGSSQGSYSSGWDDSYILYDTAVRYISAGELSDWSAYELAAARNEIFARHGRIFVTEQWSSYFAQKSWYVPKYENVDDLLNDYEWANLDVIMKLEEKFY